MASKSKEAAYLLAIVPVLIFCQDEFIGIHKVTGSLIADNSSTLNQGDVTSYVVVDKFRRHVQRYVVGDVVVIIDPEDPNTKLMRRIRGTNKEWIRYVKDDIAYVNIVPHGKCFVTTDDKDISAVNDSKASEKREASYVRERDSSDFGPVSIVDNAYNLHLHY